MSSFACVSSSASPVPSAPEAVAASVSPSSSPRGLKRKACAAPAVSYRKRRTGELVGPVPREKEARELYEALYEGFVTFSQTGICGGANSMIMIAVLSTVRARIQQRRLETLADPLVAKLMESVRDKMMERAKFKAPEAPLLKLTSANAGREQSDAVLHMDEEQIGYLASYARECEDFSATLKWGALREKEIRADISNRFEDLTQSLKICGSIDDLAYDAADPVAYEVLVALLRDPEIMQMKRLPWMGQEPVIWWEREDIYGEKHDFCRKGDVVGHVQLTKSIGEYLTKTEATILLIFIARNMAYSCNWRSLNPADLVEDLQGVYAILGPVACGDGDPRNALAHFAPLMDQNTTGWRDFVPPSMLAGICEAKEAVATKSIGEDLTKTEATTLLIFIARNMAYSCKRRSLNPADLVEDLQGIYAILGPVACGDGDPRNALAHLAPLMDQNTTGWREFVPPSMLAGICEAEGAVATARSR